ncbi:MAG: hypothetical protein CEE42_01370 [Promethearchaeota archaeon Loki_b31]|nr:MAG: hypothetical protein CEE42_01370 [Candidatus Lokiarchaeota archaeon Loki_b31]
MTLKHYSEVIFLELNEFFIRVKELEKEYGDKFIEININQEFLMNCMQYNPFCFEGNYSICKRFKEFIFLILRKYRNSKCEKTTNEQIIPFKYEYENEYVPLTIMNTWNQFINRCLLCVNKQNRNLELLTCDEIGSNKKEDVPEYFNRVIVNLIDWLNNVYGFINISTEPERINVDLKSKMKGNWAHSKTKGVMSVINKLLNSNYIKEIYPIEKSRKVNENRLEIVNFNQLKIYIKDKIGTQLFIINTTAKNEIESIKIMENMLKIIPTFKVK